MISNKNILLLSFLLFLVSISILFQSLSKDVSAAINTPIMGHPWAQMECNTDGLCVVGSGASQKVGIGIGTPAEKLDIVGNLKVSGKTNICSLVYFDNVAPAETCPSGYYTWSGMASGPTGYMLCCKVDNPI